MKSKNLFITLGLAVTLGVAGLAGVSMMKGAEKVSAGTATTVYYAVDSATVGSYTVKVNAKLQGNEVDDQYAEWTQATMTKETDTFGGKDVYKGQFTDNYNGLSVMQFQLYDGETFKSQVVAVNYNWTSPTVYNGKVWVHGGSSWQTYIPDGSAKHTVTTHVTQADGTTIVDGSQEVVDGELPTNPSVEHQFGKQFSGWYSDAQMTTPLTSVTADIPAYGAIVDRTATTHTVDVSLVPTTFSNTYVYLYDKLNACDKTTWPGDNITSTKTFTVPSDTMIIINNGNGTQTWDVADNVGSKAYLRVLNETYEDTGKYKTEWADAAADVPATTGYYIMSSENAWNFATAVKMSTEDLDTGNCAEYFDYEGKEGEKIYIRGWTQDEGQDPHISYGHYAGGEIEGVGNVDGDGNFVFAADVHIDIFAKWEETTMNFYVRKHAESYDITVYHVTFIGATKVEKEAEPHVERATEGIDFNYDYDKANYAYFGLFTDEACTTAAPKQFEANTTVYAKYVRVDGIYVYHDPDWTLDTAFYLSTENKTSEANYCEGTVTVPNTATAEAPYAMKPYKYNGTEFDAYSDISLGMEYSYASIDAEDYNNVKFTKGGTFAVYVVVDPQSGHATIWLNEGLAAFNTKFHNEINAVCDATTGNTDIDELKVVWAGLEVAYNELSDKDKADLKAHEDADSLATYNAYEYIIHKYGTDVLDDFIFERTIQPQGNLVTADNNVAPVALFAIVASIALLSTASIITVVVIKRRRFSK